MNINTSNRDVRDVGIAAGAVILVNIVWGFSSDLISQRRAKKAEKALLTVAEAMDALTADIEAYLASRTLALKEVVDNSLIVTGKLVIELGSDSQKIIYEGLIAKYKASDVINAMKKAEKDVKAVADTLTEVEATFPGTASIVEDVLTSREIPAEEVPVEVKDLGTFANAAGEAVEAFSALLEDTEASTKELEEAQSLCKNALKSFQQMINMLEGVDVTDHQYRYANILSCYELKLPALKKAKAANARKAKTVK